SDAYDLPDFPETYVGYDRLCGRQPQCLHNDRCPDPGAFDGIEEEAFIKAVAELLDNEEKAKSAYYLIGRDEFDYGFFQTHSIAPDEQTGVKQSLMMDKFLKCLVRKFGTCKVKNLLERRCPANATLSGCSGDVKIKCNPDYPYRSYDGSCNNLQHATWGRRGRALKHPIAPCYTDAVSTPARSVSGEPLPQNRKLVADLADELVRIGESDTNPTSMFLVFFAEFVTLDMIGRATRRTQHATEGFRGCRADGSDRSAFVSPLVNPLRVPPGDHCYGRVGVRCLNFSPQEKANDRCELKYAGDRNLESSYLDLSGLYGKDPDFDRDGKLELRHCGVTRPLEVVQPLTAQFLAIGGLFGQLHNYCVDQVRSCGHSKRGPVEERCRALTIGVYQKLIYDQLLPYLFGQEFLNRCALDCKYNPRVESTVSMLYRNGPGRFPHIWIPDKMQYKTPSGNLSSYPFNVFFHDHGRFECTGVLEGVVKSPIVINRIAKASSCMFFGKDGERGTCLHCLDLARNRDSGLCPLLTYKHYIERLVGEEGSSKCYETFEDLKDMFHPKLIPFLKARYQSPADIDVLLSIVDERFYRGGNVPKLVAQTMCLEFKRLKCTDRFFYTWNAHLGEGARHLIEILDFTALLALFTEMEEVPLEPFIVDGPKVAAPDVRQYLASISHLFCQV
ncbi:chorion peroxidase-like, partial [Anopheles bellator]|uniref:chorion peroxidase-like n=1 Tax=Anopheles bellator TaxID=139047 RepID=UPI0026477ED9